MANTTQILHHVAFNAVVTTVVHDGPQNDGGDQFRSIIHFLYAFLRLDLVTHFLTRKVTLCYVVCHSVCVVG